MKYLKLRQVHSRYLIYVLVIYISAYIGHGKDHIWAMAQRPRVGQKERMHFTR